MKKLTIGVESFEELRKRSITRARLLDKKVKIEPEARITFESAEGMLRCLTPLRLELIEAARRKEASITELAQSVGRNRTAVQRDVRLLSQCGMLKLRKSVNPGHGQVQTVKATARKITLTVEV
jgi:predicted transcriptional regulator